MAVVLPPCNGGVLLHPKCRHTGVGILLAGGGKDKGKSSTVKLCVTNMYEDTVLS
jgi:hypothetical protein